MKPNKYSYSASFALVIAALISSACGSQPVVEKTTIVAKGRIVAVFHVPESGPAPTGAYRPGMGGAVGGVVAALLPRIDGKGAFYAYEIQDAKRSAKIAVHTTQSFSVGECVEVLSAPGYTNVDNFLKGEARLKASENCAS
jgi:hypothetical protein